MMVFARFAATLADAASVVLRPYYRATFTSEAKPDLSLVTHADREAEAAMRALIKQHYPDYGIIGEEYSNENTDAEYVWVLDPIDGTASFVAGRPIFGTLIALLHHQKPILGIIDQPVTGERWIGIEGEPTRLNNRVISVRPCDHMANAILATTSPDLFTSAGKAFFDNIKARTKQTIYGGDCYNYALLATGQIDLVIEEGLKPHDVMALIPIVEGAGGVITDWQGNSLHLSDRPANVIASSDKKLLAKIINNF